MSGYVARSWKASRVPSAQPASSPPPELDEADALATLLDDDGPEPDEDDEPEEDDEDDEPDETEEEPEDDEPDETDDEPEATDDAPDTDDEPMLLEPPLGAPP